MFIEDINEYETYLNKRKRLISNIKTKEIQVFKKKIYTLDFISNSSNQILVGGSEQSIKLIDINSSKNIYTEFKHHSDSINQIASSPKDPNIFSSISVDKSIYYLCLWDIRTKNLLKEDKVKTNLKNLKFSPDNKYIFSTNKDGDCLFMYDISNFNKFKSDEFSKTKINDLEICNNDIITCNDNGYLWIININDLIKGEINTNSANNNSKIIIDASYPHSINCINYSHEKSKFLLGGTDSGITLWDSIEFLPEKKYKKSEQNIKKLLFNGDDNLFSCCYEGSGMDIFDVYSGEMLLNIPSKRTIHGFSWGKEKTEGYILGYAGDTKGREGDEGNIHLIIF